jgi:succinate dehydrogenase/fumarate reductase flavoprotein subunit
MIQELPKMGIKDKSQIYNTNLVEFLEFSNMLELAQSVAVCALKRRESRGAHFREDMPNQDENFAKHTIIYKEDDILHVSFGR